MWHICSMTTIAKMTFLQILSAGENRVDSSLILGFVRIVACLFHGGNRVVLVIRGKLSTACCIELYTETIAQHTDFSIH
jgi:hypothetical protein